MDNRAENSVDTQITVRVWGIDADGRPFFQNTNASDLSSGTALVSGISHPLKPGDVIGVQFDFKKARFSVVSVTDSGLPRKINAKVQLLPGQRSPWQELVGSEDTPQFIPTASNKRRFVRHKILFPIEISFEDSRRSHMQTSATDIGGRGCYVETLLPLQLGTKVIITFWLDSEKIRTTGMVKASDPGVGMGIEFTALDNTVQERLQAHLEKMDDGLASRDAAKGATTS
ncbi:MAG: PilZ domain-containing protein [Terriglobales bacterium]